jgi:uncharacterized protein (DUF433 family)
LNAHSPIDYLNIGAYTIPEAATLLKAKQANVRRWLSGYTTGTESSRRSLPPLWRIQLPRYDDHVEIGFKDLIELKFVLAFMKQGIKVQTIRRCLEEATKILGDDHPFSTRRFKTDGRSIFLASIDGTGKKTLLNLSNKQFVFERIVQQTFKDLDIAGGTVASWRPFLGKQSIVVDPKRSFGQPIVKQAGIPTSVIRDAMAVERNAKSVARFYEVSIQEVRDAVSFEQSLLAA